MTRLLLSDDERRQANAGLAKFMDEFEALLASAKHVVPPENRPALEHLLQEPFPRSGLGVGQFFTDVREQVVPNSTLISHPRFLAYVVGTANGIAPYADAVATVLNQNAGFSELGGAASVIEQAIINWVTGIFDYGPSAGGILTSGGSTATLNAISLALTQSRPDFRHTGLQSGSRPLVLYVSDEAHKSVAKAAATLGIGLDNVRVVPTDNAFRMRTEDLGMMIGKDRESGKEPFCVVANAGTVTSGAIDPIDDIARICRSEDIWLHVDGAYGAFFILSGQRSALGACRQADSITLDPHKLLFSGLEAGCLIVKEKSRLAETFAFHSSYLPENSDPLLLDHMDHGIQLSRRFNALRIWAALRTFGVEAFEDATRKCLELAEDLGHRLAVLPAIELLAPVELSAVCFRTRQGGAEDQRRLLHALNEETGTLFGPALLGHKSGLRACVANFRTTTDDINLIVDFIHRWSSR